ncbi:MAG: DUF697 domain-containing protein [Leptolyngbya sp. DLM2.Bin15]|nr:MAG: DUF697 domain-containing protein [Leptolyngbya sp. DLM2.Bin15]
MAITLQRPILIGGLGLTASIWLLDSLGASVIGLGDNLVWAIALGSGIWWMRHRRSPVVEPTTLPKDRPAVEAAIQSAIALIDQLEGELQQEASAATPGIVDHLRSQLEHLQGELDRSTLRLAIVGDASVGKTAIAHQLTQQWLPQVSWSADVTAVTISEVSSQAIALEDSESALQDADLVLLVTPGDLTESNYQALVGYATAGQRVLVAFNKQDQYPLDERSLLLHQVRQRVAAYVQSVDVVAIAAEPAAMKVRKHLEDGTVQESWQQSSSDLAALTQTLTALIPQGRSLVLATVARQVQQVRVATLAELNRYRRQRAMPLIEQAQWIAAAAAFANPVPSLDLLATAAVNAQLVLDLGKVYQQSFSMEQAKAVAGTMAKLMVQMGVVELSTQAIAPLLKTHALTFAAGGALQGMSAAYLTRLAGLSLVDYFQAQSLVDPSDRTPFSLQPELLKQRLNDVFRQMQPLGQVRALVDQGLRRLAPTA